MALPKIKQANPIDFYTRWVGHPRYNFNLIVEEDPVEVIVQKLEMVLFTEEGAVLGDAQFGSDLIYYLWQTQLSNENLRQVIIEQIEIYIPELTQLGYDFELQLFEGEVRDILYLNFVIRGYNVQYLFA
jgi:hypothetical protein